MCIRSATRTSNLAHLPGKCFSSEDSHTEISKRFAWNALSRWHFISASLHLLYLHMFIVQNQKYYCIILRLCQRSHLSISECYDFNYKSFLYLHIKSMRTHIAILTTPGIHNTCCTFIASAASSNFLLFIHSKISFYFQSIQIINSLLIPFSSITLSASGVSNRSALCPAFS